MEELDLSRSVLPVLGGALALLGGLLTFVNGRLNEAKSPGDRSKVLMWTIFGIVMLLNVSAILALALFDNAGAFLALTAPVFAISSILFVRNPKPATRAEILQMCISTGMFFLFVALFFISQLVEVIGLMTR